MTNQQANKVDQAWAKIVSDVWKDQGGALLARLQRDPKAVFKEYGVDIPDGVDVSVLANSPGKLQFVVPVKPTAADDLADKDVVEVYQACPGTQLSMAGGR